MELRPTFMNFEVNLDNDKLGQLLTMVYADVKCGILIYNFIPPVFKSLILNLIGLA